MRFNGIYTPIVTPFHENGSIDWDGYADVLQWQIDNKVAGVVVGGSTGEFYAMSKKERIQQFKFAADHIKGRIELIAGVNDIRVEECIEITIAAKNAGADSLLVAAPPYSLPSEKELAHHVLTVANVSELPIMLYNYPGRTGVGMGNEFLDLVAKHKNIAAIKESSGNANRIPLLARNYSDIELIVGGEEQVLEFTAWGAKAWVCVTSNFFPAECVKLMDMLGNKNDFEQGRRLMSAFMPLMTMLEQSGSFLQCVKYCCELQGRPAGSLRLPMLKMDEDVENEMATVFAETRNAVDAVLNEKD